MKQKDYTLIAVIAIISAVISMFLSSTFISSSDKTQTAETVEPLSSVFDRPPKAYYNQNSVNPTREIQIQTDPDSNPFNE